MRIAVGGGIHPGENGDHPAKNKRQDGKKQRKPKPAPDQLADRQVVLERLAKIAAHKARDPDQEALIRGLIQAIAAVKGVDLVWRQVTALLA